MTAFASDESFLETLANAPDHEPAVSRYLEVVLKALQLSTTQFPVALDFLKDALQESTPEQLLARKEAMVGKWELLETNGFPNIGLTSTLHRFDFRDDFRYRNGSRYFKANIAATGDFAEGTYVVPREDVLAEGVVLPGAGRGVGFTVLLCTHDGKLTRKINVVPARMTLVINGDRFRRV